jgi:1-acyl-sn-glycerol-3-phosphate acyltransferase
MKWLSHRVFTILGWDIDGEIPDIPKMVLIGAPHTSNWDFFLFLAALHHFRIKVKFLGKASLFRWPFGFMFRSVGGLPVVRSRRGGLVRLVKAAFDEADEMILVIAPEGTRRAVDTWKSGFVEIAHDAGVPVVFAGVDGANKILTIGDPQEVGDDRTAFMDLVRTFYSDKPGLNPSGKGPVQLDRETAMS